MIPHYQEASLQGENIAKRRVMKKAKESFEGEEQRALKSGQVINELKIAYRGIVQNLQLQITTLNVTKSIVESSVAAATGNFSTPLRRDKISEDGFSMDDEGDFRVVQSGLHSLFISTLGKLVLLSSQLKILCSDLADKVRESGKPITGSADLSKINSLILELAKSYGSYGQQGFSKGLAEMIKELINAGGIGVIQLSRLFQLYGENMSLSSEIIGKLQRNEYETNIESVLIPSKSTNMRRRGDVASGSERREFTGEEYKLLVQLRDAGLLRGDDFTSVYSGARDDDSSIASSRRSRSYRQPNIRYSRRGYVKEGDSDSSVFSDNEGTMLIEGSDSDDDTRTTGSGLYSIPASHRFPQRVF